jgi:ribosomal protein S18 acetylase RimI-like enzyme
MRPWTLEHGTLWAIDAGGRLPPLCQAQVQAAFAEVRGEDLDDLTRAMNLPTPEPIRRRMQCGRRCFCLRVAGRIAAYGWVTRGAEYVGELEREFHLRDDEAYIWDCATLPAWRGRRCYSALLSQLAHQLGREGARHIWIGASRQNQASVGGFVNAGFKPVIDLSYCRAYRLTLMWIYQSAAAQHSLVAAAYRILLNAHEWRLGQLALGYRR